MNELESWHACTVGSARAWPGLSRLAMQLWAGMHNERYDSKKIYTHEEINMGRVYRCALGLDFSAHKAQKIF